jgi:hypothetical protein
MELSATHSVVEIQTIVVVFFVTVALFGFLTAAWCSDALRCCDDVPEEKAPVLSADTSPLDDPETETDAPQQASLEIGCTSTHSSSEAQSRV